MNRDAEVAERFLAWLLQVANPMTAPPDCQEPPEPGVSREGDRSGAEPLPWVADSSDLEPDSSPVPQDPTWPASLSHTLGELSTVQDYIYTLLKRRLRVEIEKNPPLFPWETEIQDYPLDLAGVWGLASPQWEQQLSRFQGPIPLPQDLLQHLFTQVQALAQTSLKSGLKLVQMVEDLFPAETETLHHLAGVVLMSPSRSAGASTLLDDATLRAQLPDSYATASLPQQMVVSLLTAHNVLNWFTVALTAHQAPVQREWPLADGMLTLHCAYTDQLQIEVDLPGGGRIHLDYADGQALAPRHLPLNLSCTREDSGRLSITLPHPLAPATYTLAVTGITGEATTLYWTIALVA